MRRDSIKRPSFKWKGQTVLDLGKTAGGLLGHGPKLQALLQPVVKLGLRVPRPGPVSSKLREVHGFGSNPGELGMFVHLPSHMASNSPLVIVLHGCAQTAEGYCHGAGWSTLADRYGFALILPQQQRSNNPNLCFNWFQTEDTKRGQGEALSIRQMVEKMVRDHGIDRNRVYVTGLSAGGAMTSVMLATYPDVFAGGAIIAGLPYGAASNVQEAFETMFQSPQRPAQEWGELVRDASAHAGPWPRVSVWHGSADATVVPSNADEIVKQWTNVHGLAPAPTIESIVDGYPRQVWRNRAGEDLIESYTIPDMAHGTPLAVGNDQDQCGAAGAFLLDVGISSSYHIAKFWGIAATPLIDLNKNRDKPVAAAEAQPAAHEMPAGRETGAPKPAYADVAGASSKIPASIRAVINQALAAAGLTKLP
jgi:poly(hydroxyalkanoate) depolymerase family esterase